MDTCVARARATRTAMVLLGRDPSTLPQWPSVRWFTADYGCLVGRRTAAR